MAPIFARDLITKRTLRFETIGDLREYIVAERICSLIETFTGCPFRAYFDIDFARNLSPNHLDEEERQFTFEYIRDTIVGRVVSVFEEDVRTCVRAKIAADAFAATIFVNQSDDKISYHIIFPYLIFENSRVFAYIANSTADTINREFTDFLYGGEEYAKIIQFIDKSPINRNGERSLRINETFKYDKKAGEFCRRKLHDGNSPIVDFGLVAHITPSTANVVIWEDSIVVALRIVNKEKYVRDDEVRYDYSDCVEQMKKNHPENYVKCLKITSGLTYVRQSGTLVYFARNGNEINCLSCDDTHSKDRAIYAVTAPDHIIFRCMQNDQSATPMPIRLRYSAAKSYWEKYYVTGDVVSDLRPFVEYMRDEDFTLFIKAVTGYGKTEFLLDYINVYFPMKSVCAITNRRTFAISLTAKQNGVADGALKFINYSDIKEPMISSAIYLRVVIQAESLHRLLDADFDILILDELVSILYQFLSRTTGDNSPADNFAVFKKLLLRAKIVICMDAYLTDDDIRYILALRPKDVAAKTVVVDKKARAPADIYRHKSRDTIDGMIERSIGRGEPIAICSSLSAKRLNALAKHLAMQDFGNTGRKCRVRCITSLTSSAEKNEFFGSRLESILDETDVFLYSPTLSAGVSYVKKRFVKLFCMFSVHSASVLDCAQMVNRIRNYPEMHVVFVGTHVKNDDAASVDEMLQLKCNRLGNNIGIPASHVDRVGWVGVEDSAEFKLWSYLLRRDICARNDFCEVFLHLMGERGSRIIEFGEDLPKSELAANVKKELVEFENAANVSLAETKLVDDFEFEKLNRMKDMISEVGILQIKKYKLVCVYGTNITDPNTIKIAADARNMTIYSHRRRYHLGAYFDRIGKTDDERIAYLRRSFDPVKESDYGIMNLFTNDHREKVVESLYIAGEMFRYPMYDHKVRKIISKEKMEEIRNKFLRPDNPQDKKFAELIYRKWCSGKEKTFNPEIHKRMVTQTIQRILKYAGFVLEPKNSSYKDFVLYDEFFDIFDGSNEILTLDKILPNVNK